MKLMTPRELLQRTKDTGSRAKTLQASISVPVGLPVVGTLPAAQSAGSPPTAPTGTPQTGGVQT